jgi:hypothetical protein
VYHQFSGSHSVSVDGSRVFFEAVSGSDCGEARELYMRVKGVQGMETVKIGPYRFQGANAQGTRLLVEDRNGGLMGYDVATSETQAQSADEIASEQELSLLGLGLITEAGETTAFYHPRYEYLDGEIAGVPAGGPGGEGVEPATLGDRTFQVFRYDSVERVVECVSCASSSDPEPARNAFLDGLQGRPSLNGGLPDYSPVSGDGRFAFFTTPAALVPGDVDGEVSINSLEEYMQAGATTSPSSDVYEWRALGVDGCVRLAGCLSLITDGRGGYLNLLLGTAHDGRDVFVYTRSKLLPQDNDTSGDLYDVRVGGGFPAPPGRPVECEGDACSSPPLPPLDVSPSSMTFSGEGNVVVPSSSVGKATVKAKKAKRVKRGRRGRRVRRRGRRSVAGRAGGVRGGGRGRGVWVLGVRRVG